jgi:deazaflavin-dependent oxidoreductase (nitroreductase family)
MAKTFDFADTNRTVIEEFRANGGTADGRIFVFASKGGSDSHPDRYRNVVTHPDVTVELGTETFPATARVLTGPEQTRSARSSALRPQFAEYQRISKRVIPVVELVRSPEAL